MRPYGGHLPRICTCCSRHDASQIDRTAEYRASKRRERFRAANDAAQMAAPSEDTYLCVGALDCRCACCDDDQDGLDAFDWHPLTPLALPLLAVALRELEAA